MATRLCWRRRCRLSEAGLIGALLHAAGLSPALADWRSILVVNLVATERLLQAIEPSLGPGTTAVLIASMVGHAASASPHLDAVLTGSLAPDFLDSPERLSMDMQIDDDPFGMKTQDYFASKRKVIRMCEPRAPAWAKKGARIVFISPGMIYTPMARRRRRRTPCRSRC